MDIPWDYDSFEERIQQFASTRSDIRAAVVFGSRARRDRPADTWSDIDIALVTADASPYLESAAWLDELGDPLLTFCRQTPIGEFDERHVVFDDGLEADLVPVSLERVQPLDSLPTAILSIFEHGFRFLVDKDDLETVLESRLAEAEAELEAQSTPDEQTVVETINRGWYRIFWTAKKLRRGELWTATRGINVRLIDSCLLPMLRWHARVVHDREPWYAGRFLEDWADERALEDLQHAVATYDERQCWRALVAATDLFRWTARETTADLECTYPESVDDRITGFVQELAPEDLAVEF